MIRHFKIFVAPTDDGNWETWISWVPDGPFSTEEIAIRRAQQLATSYETDDIAVIKQVAAVDAA